MHFPRSGDPADDAFASVPLKPSRFWAILRGTVEATAAEVEYIRAHEQLCRQAHDVLTQCRDPRASWFRLEPSTPDE